MSKQSVSEIIDSWETHGLQNLHEISLDRIYAFPLTRNDLDIRESSILWHLDHYGISRQKLLETKDEQVKNLMVDIDLQVREVSENYLLLRELILSQTKVPCKYKFLRKS